jgi:hypothetical protein
VFVPIGTPAQPWHADDNIREGKGERRHRYFTILIHLNTIDENCGGTEIWSRLLQVGDMVFYLYFYVSFLFFHFLLIIKIYRLPSSCFFYSFRFVGDPGMLLFSTEVSGIEDTQIWALVTGFFIMQVLLVDQM